MSSAGLVEFRGAEDLDEVDAAYDLAARVFGPSYYEAFETMARVRELEPLRDMRDVVIGVSGGRVVAFARILDREIYTPAGLLRAGGVTSVCVHPEFRGKGNGLRLMEAVLERQWQRRDDISVLFARRAVDGWYPLLGYLGLGVHTELRVEEEHTPGVVRRLGGEPCAGIVYEHIDSYAEAYIASYGPLWLSFFRSPDWWNGIEKRIVGRIRPTDFSEVRLGSDVIGYFVRKHGMIIELSALAGKEVPVLDCVAQHAISSSSALSLRVPTGHWASQILYSTNHTYSVRFAWDGGHMLRILNKQRFLDPIQNVTPVALRVLPETVQKYDMRHHSDASALLRYLIGFDIHGADAWREGNRQANWYACALPVWSLLDEL